MLSEKKVISQGAEARVYTAKFLDQEIIVKERFPKKYRHPVLDGKITKRRITSECRNIVKALTVGIDAPCVFFVCWKTNSIYMEFIDGCKVKDFLKKDGGEESLKLCERLGQQIARLHDSSIIHGDLTTANMMLRSSDPTKIVFIDFGLSFQSSLAEDKAVDLYVLERQISSAHDRGEEFFARLLDKYKTTSVNGNSVVKHYQKGKTGHFSDLG